MAFKCIEREWCPLNNSYRHGYVLDSVDDVASLPACCPGSVAIVADNSGAVYMVNASGEWKQKAASGGNSSVGGASEESMMKMLSDLDLVEFMSVDGSVLYTDNNGKTYFN